MVAVLVEPVVASVVAVVVEAVVVEAVVVEAVVVEAVVAAADPVDPSSCAVERSTTCFITSDFGDDVLVMNKAVGEAPGCPSSGRGILFPVSDRGERGVRRVLDLPFLGEASPWFNGAVEPPASAGTFADVAPCTVKAASFAAVTLPGGFVNSDAFDPSCLARCSPGMTDCARVRTAGDVAAVAVVGVDAVVVVVAPVAAVLDGFDAGIVADELFDGM
ncbi:MAG: hypothetical protein JWR22_4193 [Herminiimonas sp.]|nr:hypothetical protein [Herminiimonas sp.]